LTSGRPGAAAAGRLGTSGVLGAIAAGSSATVLRRLLDQRLPPVSSALLTTALFGGGAAALASIALERLRTAWPLVPQETVASVQQDVRAATDAAATPPEVRP